MFENNFWIGLLVLDPHVWGPRYEASQPSAPQPTTPQACPNPLQPKPQSQPKPQPNLQPQPQRQPQPAMPQPATPQMAQATPRQRPIYMQQPLRHSKYNKKI